MSSNEYATPLTLNLKPSRLAASILFFAHLGAFLSIILVPMTVFLKMSLSVLILASLWDTSNRVLLKKADAIRQIIWSADNTWIFLTATGQAYSPDYSFQLLPSSYVHVWMTVLNYQKVNYQKTNDQKTNYKLIFNAKYCRFRSCVLLPDAIDPDELRHLRVRLMMAQYSLAG